ncbi:MAG: alpha/beta hydrolase [Gemmatimonadaceae bacterium]|nr:alpha/beta hydrolase [Chitinophagaceae bacterium]
MDAADQGILVIIPTFKNGISSFGFDTATQASFLEILGHIQKTQKVNGLKFYLGGFSIGGTCSIKYAELSIKNNYPVKPSAVFVIDAPLDFERMYFNMLRETKLPGSPEEALAESNYILKRCITTFGGTPADKLENYRALSPYSYNDSTQNAIKPLINLPLRLYTEPDILWWLKEGVDYSLMNSYDLAALYNELRRMGNKKAAFIPTQNAGRRKPNNTPHPHSWSIAEPKDLLKWLLSQ